MRINDLLNAFLYLANPDEPAAVAAIFPGLAAAAPGLRSAAAAAAAPAAALVPTSAGARAAEALRHASSPAAVQTPKQWPPSQKPRLAAAQGGAAASAATAETPAAAAARQPGGYGTDAAPIAPTAAPAAGTVEAAEATAADLQRVQLLVGDKYYAAKGDLIHREQVRASMGKSLLGIDWTHDVHSCVIPCALWLLLNGCTECAVSKLC